MSKMKFVQNKRWVKDKHIQQNILVIYVKENYFILKLYKNHKKSIWKNKYPVTKMDKDNS